MPFPLPIESAGLREPEEQAGTTSLSNDDPTREYGALGGTLETPQPLFPLQASTTEIAAMGGTLPPPTMPVRRGNPSFAEFDTNDPFDGAPPYSMAPQRRRVGGWIVAVILLLGVGLIGYRIGMPYLTSGEKGNAAVAALDPRAVRFLTDGEHAMEDGNLDLARENFDKASALGERDPRVLLDLAKLATVRGDIPWLKLRLLPESAEDDVKETKQELLGLVPGMRKAADEAAARAPEDTAAVRVRIDAMRIGGDVDLARSLVSKAGTSSQAETSYVLATLDVAEMSPPWNTVIDRLRIAAAAEGNLGRARAMLVYALARAGDTAAAKAQLDRLAALSRLHPLVGSLRAFLARGSTKGEAEAHGAPVVGSASAAAHGNTQPRPPGGQEPPDPRFLVQQAAEAENRGQLGRAAKLYEDAVRIDGRNSEAHAGLGSVSLKQGDPATARQHFDRALAINPNYVPALVGQADALWQEGDKNGAMAKYKDLVDRFPESSGYPAYVKTRVAGSSSGAASSAAPAGGASPVTPETTPSANPKPSEGSPGAKPNELTLPSNVPSDLPGTP
jgi:tetratricopeptide (TPR) repeat protein